jgi:hypothetical protein
MKPPTRIFSGSLTSTELATAARLARVRTADVCDRYFWQPACGWTQWEATQLIFLAGVAMRLLDDSGVGGE